MKLSPSLIGALAARPLSLSLDAASAEPGKFAAAEIRREAAAKTYFAERAELTNL